MGGAGIASPQLGIDFAFTPVVRMPNPVVKPRFRNGAISKAGIPWPATMRSNSVQSQLERGRKQADSNGCSVSDRVLTAAHQQQPSSAPRHTCISRDNGHALGTHRAADRRGKNVPQKSHRRRSRRVTGPSAVRRTWVSARSSWFMRQLSSFWAYSSIRSR